MTGQQSCLCHPTQNKLCVILAGKRSSTKNKGNNIFMMLFSNSTLGFVHALATHAVVATACKKPWWNWATTA
jgi:hypothetical protein